jgi:multiple sugar transport system permease protein
MFPNELAPRARPFYLLALTGLLLVWLVPVLAIGVLSTRSASDIAAANYWDWPTLSRIYENYASIFVTAPFSGFLANSLVITATAVVGTLAVSMLAGYAIATLPFRGARLLLAIFVAGNLVPAQVLMIPVRDFMLHTLPLYNTRAALILFHIAFQTGFCTFFMTNFIRSIPGSYLEAARLDGASEWRILTRIAVPLVRPALAALAVLEFVFIWNDYFWSLVLVQSDSVRPVTAALQTLKGMYAASGHLLAASALIAACIPATFFFILQRYFVSGLTGGALRP